MSDKHYSFLRRAFITEGELIPVNEEEVKLFDKYNPPGELPESLRDFEALKKRVRERRNKA